MEEEKTETLTAESDKEREVSYGKFKSAEELLKAYNSLQSEFTKRSQKLKEYETKNAETEKLEGQVAEFVEKYPIAEKFADEIATELANAQKDGGPAEKLEGALIKILSGKIRTAEQMAEDEEVINRVLNAEKNREKIIEGYLEKVKSNEVPKVLPKGGAIPVAAPVRPKNIREAGMLALKIIEQ